MNGTAHPYGMLAIAECTRRFAFRLCASLLLNGGGIRLSALGHSSSLQQVVGTVSTDSASWTYREYAVHATVMLGSLPLCSKRNVGGAAMAFEQAVHNQSVLTALQFVAGSWPDRLRGFNRFGAIQEVVREENETITQSAYVGFMPTSHEKGLNDARNSFASAPNTQIFTVAFGKATAAGCTFLTQHRVLEEKLRWTNCAAVLDGIDAGVTLPPQQRAENYGSGCLPTFLFAVHRALTSHIENPTTYIHNGKVYRLRTQWKSDHSSGNRMITGWTSPVGERAETEFRFWVAPADSVSLPVKIEFRARSFLKLTLETEHSSQGCTLKPLLKTREAVA